MVRGAALPRYLDRIEVVRAAGGGRLRVADNDWWGEPLRAMLRRVLVADLAQRLPGADVLADEGPAAARPEAEVELEVQRFEPDGTGAGGPVVLEGYMSITASTGPGQRRTLERLHVVVPMVGGTAAAQVDAMSAALGQAAEIAARRIIPYEHPFQGVRWRSSFDGCKSAVGFDAGQRRNIINMHILSESDISAD